VLTNATPRYRPGMKRILPLAILATVIACQTPQTRAPTYSPVTREHAGYCVQVCRNLGMQMTAMVVIMSSAGCVCQPARGAPSAPAPGAAAAASGAAIAAATAAAAMEAEAQRRRGAAAQQQLK